MLAAYTTTDAKLRMNKEAGKVMDEIVDAITVFSAEAQERTDELRAAVRRIVKLAVETWRYARLEREKVEAFMPPVGEQSGQEEGVGLWLPYSVDGSDGEEKKLANMLLRIFPVIRRERVQESFWFTDKDRHDRGCVYSKGCALYAE